MKFRHIFTTLVALLGAVSAFANDYAFTKPISEKAPLAVDGTLKLANVNGDVTIRTWDKAEILVEGEESAKTEDELKKIQLTIELLPAVAKIEVHLPKRDDSWWGNNTIRAAVKFVITVPATIKVEKLSVVNSGITLEGLKGPVTASSVNGNITAEGLANNAKLRTVNGRVTVSFAEVRPKNEMAFETVNGSIRVNLPADAGVKIALHAVNGGIHCDLPLTLSEKSHHGLVGTIGDGRSALEARSVNGSIRVNAGS